MKEPGRQTTGFDLEAREQLVRDRRDFHQFPELGYREERTASVVAARLEGSGYEVASGVGGTGVVGLIRATTSDDTKSRTLLYRADMDALPIREENDVEYRSRNDGLMHACGHDAHVAIGLAVAEHISRRRDELRCNLKFAFQPAEEGGNGAVAMIEQGVLGEPDVSAALGLHVWNNMPVGHVGVFAGPMMAAVDEFELTVEGRGGHGAMPHQTVDAVVVAAQVVVALQTIVSRNVAPLDSAVVTIGKLEAGSAFNVIAETARMKGTVRSFDRRTRDELPSMVERVISGVCAAMGARYQLQYEQRTLPLVNDPEFSELVASCAAEVVGAGNVHRDDSVRTMGGEDMAFFLDRVPGCYFFLGTRNESRGLVHPHHSPRFDIDETALPMGAEIMTRIILAYG